MKTPESLSPKSAVLWEAMQSAERRSPFASLLSYWRTPEDIFEEVTLGASASDSSSGYAELDYFDAITNPFLPQKVAERIIIGLLHDVEQHRDGPDHKIKDDYSLLCNKCYSLEHEGSDRALLSIAYLDLLRYYTARNTALLCLGERIADLQSLPIMLSFSDTPMASRLEKKLHGRESVEISGTRGVASPERLYGTLCELHRARNKQFKDGPVELIFSQYDSYDAQSLRTALALAPDWGGTPEGLLEAATSLSSLSLR